MQIYTTTVQTAPTTSAYLASVYIAHPEVKERIVKAICDEYSYYFTGMALGYGRYSTDGDITSNKNKKFIAADFVTWSVKPRTRQLVTVQADITAGQGGANAAFNIDLTASSDSWVKAGMILRHYNGTTGAVTQFLVTGTGAVVGAAWRIAVKIISSASETTPLIAAGATLGQTSTANASCASTSTLKPTKYLDIYRNYNTTMKPKKQICKTGLQTVTWFVGENGEKCWTPEEEYQFEKESLLDLELGIVYNETTVNSSGTVFMTDANGDSVMMGDGLLNQISSGNLINWNVSTYYGLPATYDAFRMQLKETIENWRIANGITSAITLYVHTGTKGYGFLQDVLKDYADQSGGCCFVMNYKEGKEEKMELSSNISKYRFASTTLVLLNCSVFDNPGVQATLHTESYNSPPLESFRMLIAPETDCEGKPLIELFFRGGCGLNDVWFNSVQPGTINPFVGFDTKTQISTSDYSGYNLIKEVEWNLIVNDPGKFLNFNPTM